MKIIINIVLLLAIASCVTIEAPDDLVSDTVKAGTDVYDTVKENMSNSDSSTTKRVFSHEYKIPDGETIGDSSFQCVNIVTDTAKKILNINELVIEETLTNSMNKDGESILKCSIVVVV